jgi:large subunit ribosomal protein L4
MAKIDVVNLEGKKTGTLELADEVFGGINEDLLWEAVKHYRAAGRHTPPEQAGVWRGTKALEQGHRPRGGLHPSPLWRHGGTVRGQPRSMTISSPRRSCSARCVLRLRQAFRWQADGGGSI